MASREFVEPYEVFEFLDELHTHDDEEHYAKFTFWLGSAKRDQLFDDSGGDYECAVVIEWTRDGEAEMGYMPWSDPYWHRAKHCPLRSE